MSAENDAIEPNELDGLAALLEPAAPSPNRLDHLLAEVEELPLRYAPFFDRLSALWDLPESGVRAALEKARDPHALRRVLPGARRLLIQAGPEVATGNAQLMRFSPGLRFPAHRHRGPEQVFVLEGSYTDSAGRRFGPGDEQVMQPGSEHSLSVSKDGPCVAAIVSRGLEFTGFPLRVLQKLASR